MLEGRHGGLVGTKALGENDGPCLLNGYDYGFVFGFSNVFFCKPVDVVEGIPLRACCFDGVCNVGVGGGYLFSKDVGMFINDNTGMGLYFEEVDGRW